MDLQGIIVKVTNCMFLDNDRDNGEKLASFKLP